MPIKIYTGTLKELGSGVEEASERIASAQYAYLEFEDGRMLRDISVVGGLVGKLDAALDDDGPVELHIMEGGKRSDLLVALKTSDGKTYATDLRGGALAGRSLVAGWAVLGLGLLPLFGIGGIFLWVAWRQWHGMRLMADARQHVEGLTNVMWV